VRVADTSFPMAVSIAQLLKHETGASDRDQVSSAGSPSALAWLDRYPMSENGQFYEVARL